jgi:hypothetical protein
VRDRVNSRPGQATWTHEPCLCFVDTVDTVDMVDTSRSSPLTPGNGVGGAAETDATAGVTALYRAHAVGLIRLAIFMLGERAAAEDVVQDAFPAGTRGSASSLGASSRRCPRCPIPCPCLTG